MVRVELAIDLPIDSVQSGNGGDLHGQGLEVRSQSWPA
jgi:hypothetical protein